MEAYIAKYDSLERTIVFHFYTGIGGIGDLLKYFSYMLNMCIEYDIKLQLLTDSLVDNFLKLKYEKMYATSDNPVYIEVSDIPNIQPGIIYMITPDKLYGCLDVYERSVHPSEVFDFTDQVKTHINMDPNYISIHLRLGDKHLDTDKSWVLCKNDERQYDIEKLFNFIETNHDKNILFLCDSDSYKKQIKSKYDFIKTINNPIGHTSLGNTTTEQVFNTVVEFYLLSKSQHIYAASESGFSMMASKFYNVPFSRI